MRIWFDTEFIDTGREIHLLSIGLVREDNETYYAEPSDVDRSLACPWVTKNVIPHLHGPVKPRAEIAADVVKFSGIGPEFWAYYGAYDWVLMCQLFGRMLDVPPHWPNFVMDLQQLRIMTATRNLPEQKSVEHNALNDAIWTKQAWEYVVKNK